MCVDISVIIPIFNSEKYIGRCLNDILDQTYNNFEVILIDDGSVDDSYQICQKFCKIDNRIKVIKQRNSGVSKARNTGLKIASGKYICFIDSDDRIEPNYLKNLIDAYFTCNRRIGLVIHGCKIDFYKKEKIIKTRVVEPKSNIYKFHNFLESLEKDVPLISAQTVWGKLYIKSIIKSNSLLFCEGVGLSEDFLFNLKYMYYIDEILVDSYSNYHYIKTENESSVHRYHPEYLDTVKKIILNMQNILIEPSDDFLGYVFREYCRTIYHYYSNYSRNTKNDRINVLKGLTTAPLYKESLNISNQPPMYKIIRVILMQNNIFLSNLFFSVTSLLRRY